jgi:hypothetical protein
MKASELIERLQNIVNKEGDSDILVWADHGQESMYADHATVVYTLEPDERMIEVHTLEDLDDEDSSEYKKHGTKLIEIS